VATAEDEVGAVAEVAGIIQKRSPIKMNLMHNLIVLSKARITDLCTYFFIF